MAADLRALRADEAGVVGPLPEAEAPGKIGLTGFVGNFRTREHCNGVTQL